MDCRECAEDMTAFMDGEIPSSDVARMQSHIDACPACAEEYMSLREAAELVDSHHRRVDLGAGSWDLVNARIGLRSGHTWLGHLTIRSWIPAFTMALVILGLAVGLWSYYRYQESERALQSYMAEYVREREAREQMYRLRSVQDGSAPFEYSDLRDENPFVVVRHTDEDNPFRR